jgi:hypothetical protein
MKLIKAMMMLIVLSLNQLALSYDLSRRYETKHSSKHRKILKRQADSLKDIKDFAFSSNGKMGGVPKDEFKNEFGCYAYKMCTETSRAEVFKALYLYVRYNQLPSNMHLRDKLQKFFTYYFLQELQVKSWYEIYITLTLMIGEPNGFIEKKVRKEFGITTNCEGSYRNPCKTLAIDY